MVKQSDKPQSTVKLPSLAITAQFIGAKNPPQPSRTQIRVPHVYIQPHTLRPAAISMTAPFEHFATTSPKYELLNLRPMTVPLYSSSLSIFNVQHCIPQHLPLILQPQSYQIPITFQVGASSIEAYTPASCTQQNIPTPKIEVIDMSHEIRSSTQKPRLPRKCNICGKSIIRDFSRHLRTHDRESRFKCIFPREHCPHKSGCFNRQYDFKKHLLHAHFTLRDHKVKRMKNLQQKLEHEGHCLCGKRMIAKKWLEHIVERDKNGHYSCTDLREKCENTTDDI